MILLFDYVTTKHIEIQHHYIKERVESQDVEVRYIHTTEHEANIHTKPLLGIRS
jgi:hypothetical protein